MADGGPHQKVANDLLHQSTISLFTLLSHKTTPYLPFAHKNTLRANHDRGVQYHAACLDLRPFSPCEWLPSGLTEVLDIPENVGAVETGDTRQRSVSRSLKPYLDMSAALSK